MVVDFSSQRRHIHLITPGDHYSPSTGSAVPTVVHGLSRVAPSDRPRPAVLVARGTYDDWYDSAQVVAYDRASPTRLPAQLDPLLGRLGFSRPVATRAFAASLAAQHDWPDSVVIAHNAPAAIRLIAAKHRAVLYAHNHLLRTYSRAESARALHKASTIVCVSAHLANEMAGRLPAHLRARLRVVPNGVEAGDFAGPRAPRGERLRVTFVGRVIPDKGVHVLLEAVRRLPPDRIQVTIVGRAGFSATDPLTKYERQLRVTAAELTTPVDFASFVPRPELPSLLRSADVLVVPSTWPEPFGLTALEGMAAGAAVIASDIGGLPEAVADGGMLVPPSNVASLAESLEALLTDNSLLDQWQHAGLQRAREMSWASIRRSFDAALDGD